MFRHTGQLMVTGWCPNWVPRCDGNCLCHLQHPKQTLLSFGASGVTENYERIGKIYRKLRPDFAIVLLPLLWPSGSIYDG